MINLVELTKNCLFECFNETNSNREMINNEFIEINH